MENVNKELQIISFIFSKIYFTSNKINLIKKFLVRLYKFFILNTVDYTLEILGDYFYKEKNT